METPSVMRTRDRHWSRLAVGLGSDGRLRVVSIGRLARRELVGALRGPGLYAMVTVGCLVAAVVVGSYLDFVANSGTVVLADPLRVPLLFALLATTAYLGLLSTAALAGERERGTLEVLFYGPVDAASYIVGKALGHALTYVLAAAAVVVFLAVGGQLTGMPLGSRELVLGVASLVPAVSMIALGLLLGALVRRIRPALALTAFVIISLVAIDVGSEIAVAQPGDTLLGSAAGVLAYIAAIVAWVSPAGYLFRIEDALAVGAIIDVLGALAAAAAYGLALGMLAVVVLRWRGVQRWRE